MLHEAVGRNDLNAPGGDVVGADNAAHAAEMVDVAVRVDDGAHREVTNVTTRERQRGGGGFAAGQRIDEKKARIADDNGEVRHIEAAHLIDAVGDLKEARAREQAGMTPEAGVHRFRRLALQEIVGGKIPDDAAIGGANLRGGRAGDEAARGEVLVFSVAPWQ